MQYGCVEQWMMAEKARCFGDTQTEARVMAATDPFDQKRFGREVRPYVDAQWAAVRYDIVLRGTIEKFRQNPPLLKLLLGTGDLILVEASPYDRLWGIGMRAEHPNAEDPSKWPGQNLLGKVVMAAQETLRASEVVQRCVDAVPPKQISTSLQDLRAKSNKDEDSK
jgi:hypothetical protein